MKIEQEKAVVGRMIGLYCWKNHDMSDGLCKDCTQLKEYAFERLDRCRYGDRKTACSDCKTHCYRPEQRKKIRQVMRFSGPRMIWYHPADVLHKWFFAFSRF